MAPLGPNPNINSPLQSVDEMMRPQRISGGLNMCPLFSVISQFPYGQITQEQGLLVAELVKDVGLNGSVCIDFKAGLCSAYISIFFQAVILASRDGIAQLAGD